MAEYVTYKIELSRETIEKLKIIAKNRGCSVNSLIENLIDEDYEKNK